MTAPQQPEFRQPSGWLEPTGDIELPQGDAQHARDEQPHGGELAQVGSGIQVRLADGNDLAGVVAVGRTTWPITVGELYGPDLVELFLAKWWTNDATIPAIRAGRTLVAESLDHLDEKGRPQIVGMAAYGAHEGTQVIWKLYVLPDWQGHGVGGMLLRAVLARIGDQPIYMSFADGNRSAGDFARAYGFVEDHREEQTDMPDLVWMRRDPAIGSVVLRGRPR